MHRLIVQNYLGIQQKIFAILRIPGLTVSILENITTYA